MNPVAPTAGPTPGEFGDAIRYWELRRVAYNVILLAVVVGWVVSTWPHFRPAMTLSSLGKLLVLAALANVVYCAAYLVDVPMQRSSGAVTWRRFRFGLWLTGTLLAFVFENYWIADEIYPFVQ